MKKPGKTINDGHLLLATVQKFKFFKTVFKFNTYPTSQYQVLPQLPKSFPSGSLDLQLQVFGAWTKVLPTSAQLQPEMDPREGKGIPALFLSFLTSNEKLKSYTGVVERPPSSFYFAPFRFHENNLLQSN